MRIRFRFLEIINLRINDILEESLYHNNTVTIIIYINSFVIFTSVIIFYESFFVSRKKNLLLETPNKTKVEYCSKD